MTEDDLSALRAALGARVGECWLRLEDVVSELCALHEVPEQLIVERVRTVIASEGSSRSDRALLLS